jgi:hypothetical protein
VETELDLGDHLEWIRVERDPVFVSSTTEMLASFVGGQTSGRNLVSSCLLY